MKNSVYRIESLSHYNTWELVGIRLDEHAAKLLYENMSDKGYFVRAFACCPSRVLIYKNYTEEDLINHEKEFRGKHNFLEKSISNSGIPPVGIVQ